MVVTNCFEKHYSPSSITTYISGLSFYHRINGWYCISDIFVVSKILQGCRRQRPVVDKRAPITISMLEKICSILPMVAHDHYESLMFKAIFTLTFFGLFRISELVFTHNGNMSLLFEDLRLAAGHQQVLICLRQSKTNQFGNPINLRLPCETNKLICPVCNLKLYFGIRPVTSGRLFVHNNYRPVTRYQFSAVLKKCLIQSGFDCNVFKSHSFRIGRATHLASTGVSNDQIMRMGRWNSNAYMSYIR